MDSRNIYTYEKNRLREAARRFLDEMKHDRIFAFHAEMGAGKTTFIKAVCEELGVKDVINSPSFSIINEYRSETLDEAIYHFDFFRIESPAEAASLGLAEYFGSGALCFIEWPEMIGDCLPENSRRLSICENADGSRTLSLLR
jgi:tRNA threonylcarbamoyladenosine biosynthesis protein TsaE